MNLLKKFNLIGATLLLLAILPFPYEYYLLLRLAIVVICIANIILFNNYIENKIWKIFFIISLIIFNPILPIYQSKDIWVIVDFIFALIFGLSSFLLHSKSVYKNPKQVNTKQSSQNQSNDNDHRIILIFIILLFTIVFIITENLIFGIVPLSVIVWAIFKVNKASKEIDKKRTDNPLKTNEVEKYYDDTDDLPF